LPATRSNQGQPPFVFANLEGYDHLDYNRFGGLLNAGGPSATGNIMYSTIGFELNSSFTLTIHLKKFTDSSYTGTFVGSP
jgi:hypothetical protein